MLANTNLGARLQLSGIPLLTGAHDLSSLGYRSTLYPHLQLYLHQCNVSSDADPHRLDVLLDPQTSGGLLIAMPEVQAQRFIASYPDCAIIGEITDSVGIDVR